MARGGGGPRCMRKTAHAGSKQNHPRDVVPVAHAPPTPWTPSKKVRIRTRRIDPMDRSAPRSHRRGAQSDRLDARPAWRNQTSSLGGEEADMLPRASPRSTHHGPSFGSLGCPPSGQIDPLVGSSSPKTSFEPTPSTRIQCTCRRHCLI